MLQHNFLIKVNLPSGSFAAHDGQKNN
ncbi:hypothetical protein BVIET440_20033 [Burkholderia vietnamiensis]